MANSEAGIIFDLDGTLIDSAPAITAVANDFLATLKLAPLEVAETISFIGGGSQQFVRLMLESRDAYEEGLFERQFSDFSGIYLDAAPDLNTPFAGVEEVLEELLGAGHPLALCTNKPEAPTRRIVAHFGWQQFFPVIVAGDTLTVKKPNPAPLYSAMKSIDRESVFFVGDSETDASTAAAAGQPFLLFTEGYRKTAVADLHCAASFSHYSEFRGSVASLTRP